MNETAFYTKLFEQFSGPQIEITRLIASKFDTNIQLINLKLLSKFHVARPGFLNQWATEDFAVGHRAIRQIGCSIQKSLISVISFGGLTKIGDSKALTFLSEIKAKIALPEVKTFFFYFGDQGKNRSPRGEDLFFGGQGNHWAYSADSKKETFFFEAEGHRPVVKQGWSHRAMGHANFHTTQNGPRFRKG